MDKFIKWISALAPFLASYTNWMKAIFAVWIGLGAVLLIALILARQAERAAVAQGASSQGAPAASDTGAPAQQANAAVDAAEDVQLWLIIEALDFFAASTGAQVQVTATVNRTEYFVTSGRRRATQ